MTLVFSVRGRDAPRVSAREVLPRDTSANARVCIVYYIMRWRTCALTLFSPDSLKSTRD